MSVIVPPPPTKPPSAKGLRAWLWHPRQDVGPRLVRVLRVLKGTGKVVIQNPDPGPYHPGNPAEFGVPAAWFNAPENAE